MVVAVGEGSGSLSGACREAPRPVGLPGGESSAGSPVNPALRRQGLAVLAEASLSSLGDGRSTRWPWSPATRFLSAKVRNHRIRGLLTMGDPAAP